MSLGVGVSVRSLGVIAGVSNNVPFLVPWGGGGGGGGGDGGYLSVQLWIFLWEIS